MKAVRLICANSTIGRLSVPEFQLSAGDFVCLHMPCLGYSRDEEELVHCLTGQHHVPGIQRFGKGQLALPAVEKNRLLHLLMRPKATRWLRRHAPISAHQAEGIVARLGLRSERLGELPWADRYLLGLEAAYAAECDFILFQTLGLDHSGRMAVFEAVATRLTQCPAIHLSYEYITQGRRERMCPVGATCLEIAWADSAAGPVARAEREN